MARSSHTVMLVILMVAAAALTTGAAATSSATTTTTTTGRQHPALPKLQTTIPRPVSSNTTKKHGPEQLSKIALNDANATVSNMLRDLEQLHHSMMQQRSTAAQTARHLLQTTDPTNTTTAGTTTTNTTANSSTTTVASTTVTKAAANTTTLKRFSKHSLVASDASAVAYDSFQIAKSAIQLVQPIVAGATSGHVTVDINLLLNLAQLAAQLGAYGTDLSSKISKLVADAVVPVSGSWAQCLFWAGCSYVGMHAI